MKVLVTGSSGMLGKDICGTLDSDRHDVFGVSKEIGHSLRNDRQFQGDLTNQDFINDVLEKVEPDVIVHCAAIVNVDECEKNRELVHNVHVRSTEALASYRPGNVRFIYISTDSVFDGKTGNYSEDDDTHPLNYYASSKLEGEKAALKNNPNSVILRTNIYGFHIPPGKSLTEWAIENFRLNKTINGFNDTIFNPLYTRQLALTIRQCFMNDDVCGIWNVASEGSLSKYEFLVKLARTFNYSESLVVQNSMENVTFTAPRPKKTFLNTSKLKSTFNVVLDLQSGLENYKEDYLQSIKTKK